MARPTDLTEFNALSAIARAADRFILHDDDGGELVGVLASLILRSVDPVVFPLTGNTTLVSATHNFGIVTNVGAAGLLTHTLWTPVVGDEITFCRVLNQEIRILPASGGWIGDGAVDQYLRMLSTGGSIKLRCFVNGYWTILASGVLYEFGP